MEQHSLPDNTLARQLEKYVVPERPQQIRGVGGSVFNAVNNLPVVTFCAADLNLEK